MQWNVDGAPVRKSYASQSAGVRFLTQYCNLMMNFWTPTWNPWGEDLNLSSLPWYVEYDYVEVWNYNQSTKGFEFAWRDDFNTDTIDYSRW